MKSIVYRVAGLIFLLLAASVLLLIFLTNYQMSELFQMYLSRAPMPGGMGDFIMKHGMMHHRLFLPPPPMGRYEMDFLASVHNSLIWVGALIIIAGLAVSVMLARSITVPLRRLNEAVRAVQAGHFGGIVPVTTKDEVGRLTTAFNEMNQALATDSERRRRFLADVAHELRTPLTVIQGNIEGMRDGIIDANREELQSLYEETQHLSRLIHDLRDLSLAEAGQLTLEKTPMDFNAFLSQSVDAMRPLTEKKHLSLTLRLHPVGDVCADPSRLYQILSNLLSNAIRYTPEGGSITVSSAQKEEDEKKWAVFSVSDTGIGMSADDLPHIFEHFYRADPSRNRKTGGSGIGLSIVRELAELHGGYVTAESTPGKGSTFHVYLPL